jgi:hypothetical protein
MSVQKTEIYTGTINPSEDIKYEVMNSATSHIMVYPKGHAHEFEPVPTDSKGNVLGEDTHTFKSVPKPILKAYLTIENGEKLEITEDLDEVALKKSTCHDETLKRLAQVFADRFGLEVAK